MTSYQRRKRDIKYLEQCIGELETRCFELAKQLKKCGKVPLLAGQGIKGEDFVTPYNSGEFDFDLLMED